MNYVLGKIWLAGAGPAFLWRTFFLYENVFFPTDRVDSGADVTHTKDHIGAGNDKALE